ncbi:Hsp20/alpha crystallin family protein [Halobacterium yunchengense]|uniref:Hsp20/alpha crystallin family protein n=1 Tax=Halobacterium yunchengense TaxID=3108497 RepID=UPI00300AA725
MPQRKRRLPDSVVTRLRGTDDRPAPFPVDVEDRGDEFVVSAELPGLRKQDLDVSVDGDRLRIAADFGGDDGGTYRRQERDRDRGELRRVVRLPERVDEKRVSASYDRGVLWVTLKKRNRPKRVELE